MAGQHAILSASGAERWMNCPGSIRLSAGLPDIPSEFAAEGTAAHTLAADCLQQGTDPAERMGEIIPADGFEFEVTEEMVAAVQTYIDALEAYSGAGWEVETEVALDELRQLHPDFGGTSDRIAFHEAQGWLVILDFKYGRGKAVYPQENPQLLKYALGVIRRYHNRGVKKITLGVVQPRCTQAGEPVRTWDTDPIFLLEWSADLVAAARRTEAPDAPLNPGPWCQFCKAAGICDALRGAALKVAQDEFGAVADPAAMDPDELGRRLAEADKLEVYLHRLRETGHAEATAGRMPTGFKLVAKRAVRKFRDEDRIVGFLGRNGVKREDCYQAPKLKSPAQIEPMMLPRMKGKTKKAQKEAFDRVFADYIDKTSSGTVLATLDDKRESVRPDAAEEFA
jgi:hypothetical protein